MACYNDTGELKLERNDVNDPATKDELQAVQQLNEQYKKIQRQIGGVIVGLEDVIEQLLVVLLCRGHGILEGVPGLAKTLMVSTLASLLGMTFRRIQFTPDLMPSDITGTEILEEDHTTGKRRGVRHSCAAFTSWFRNLSRATVRILALRNINTP